MFLLVNTWKEVGIPINAYMNHRIFLACHCYSFILFTFSPHFFIGNCWILWCIFWEELPQQGEHLGLCIIKMSLRDEDFILCQGVWQWVYFAVPKAAYASVFGNWLMWCDMKKIVFNQTLELSHCRSYFQLVPSVPRHTGNRQFSSWRSQFL